VIIFNELSEVFRMVYYSFGIFQNSFKFLIHSGNVYRPFEKDVEKQDVFC